MQIHVIKIVMTVFDNQLPQSLKMQQPSLIKPVQATPA